jgi:hypothetical protein
LSSDDEVVVDKEMAKKEITNRGRKLKRKRERSVQAGDFEGSDAEMKEPKADFATAVEALAKKPSRSYTPAQRKVSVQKEIRDRSQSRREGSVPPTLPYKIVPAEQIRLAKKINKKVFGRQVKVNESDRHIAVAKPKWLFAGKMSNGTRNKR